MIKQVFEHNQDLKQTMNTQECIARGATILAARVSRNPKAFNYDVSKLDEPDQSCQELELLLVQDQELLLSDQDIYNFQQLEKKWLEADKKITKLL